MQESRMLTSMVLDQAWTSMAKTESLLLDSLTLNANNSLHPNAKHKQYDRVRWCKQVMNYEITIKNRKNISFHEIPLTSIQICYCLSHIALMPTKFTVPSYIAFLKHFFDYVLRYFFVGNPVTWNTSFSNMCTGNIAIINWWNWKKKDRFCNTIRVGYGLLMMNPLAHRLGNVVAD